MISLVSEPSIKLSEEQQTQFEQKGYLAFPRFLNETHCQKLKTAVDRLLESRNRNEKPFVISQPELAALVTHQQTLEVAEQLLGPDFAMHHIHADRHDAGFRPRYWHHDYEQYPQVDRKFRMIHVFYYLNGLNGEIGDLLVLPGSHKIVTQHNLDLFETKDLPGYLAFDNLPNGSAIFVHSALLHARRPKPGGENNPRYFIDTSFCQKGVLWPAYGKQKAISDYAFKHNVDQNGKYHHLFDPTQFYNPDDKPQGIPY